MRHRPASPHRTMGVEEELILVDAITGEPVPASTSVVAAAALDDPGAAFVPEMHQEMVELVGPPHRTLAGLRRQVGQARIALDRVARSVGVRAAPLASAPFMPGAPHPSPGNRYQTLARRYGITSEQCLTCGLHVHVSIGSPDEGVAVLDRIRMWLPALRTLAANSPFQGGADTGYDSYRFELWSLWPSCGPADVYGDFAGYRRAVADQLSTGALLDEDMLYGDARLSTHFPTVEVRVCDVPLTAEATATLAGLVRGLVASAALAAARGEAVDPASANTLRLASWDASLRGLDATLFDPRTHQPAPAAQVIGGMLRYAEPGLRVHGDVVAVREGVERILVEGNGARWQRRTADALGLRGMVLAAADLGAAGPDGSALPALSGSM